MPDALALLKTRRSVKPDQLTGPAPSPEDIDTMLTVASRVPDHGKLTPWRFILFEGDHREEAGAAIASAFAAKYADPTGDQLVFESGRLARAPLVIDHLNTLAQAAELLLIGLAAIKGKHGNASLLAVTANGRSNLDGQFAGRGENQCLDAFLPGSDPLQQRQAKGGGFAGTGLRLADQSIRVIQKISFQQ